MSARLCTDSFHDEIFNFIGVERTNIEINLHLFDNANKVEKISNDRQIKKINQHYRGKLYSVC